MVAIREAVSENVAILRLVRASPDDSEDIWTWRNDERTRSMSISSGFIERDVHEAWFSHALADPLREFFIGVTVAEGTKIGMCRFDLDADKSSAEVSINLNPAMRGKGWAKPLLADAVRRYAAESSVSIKATVKRHNAAAVRCFLDCGFHLRADDGEYLYFMLDSI